MKVQDIFGSAASGSTGSKTASRNRGGQYLRNRAVPTNPNTARQANVREGLGVLTPQWSNLLTQPQRDAWNLYGQNVPVVDVLGATIKLSGINHFVRSNAPRVQAGLDVITDAPVVFNIGDTPQINVLTFTETDGIDIEGTILLPALETDIVLVYIGRPTNAGVSYFRGPYRYFNNAGAATEDGAWGVSGSFDGTPYIGAVGQRIFIRAQTSRTDGRLSADAQGTVIITSGA